MQPYADNPIAGRFDTVIYDRDGTVIDSARDMCVVVSRVPSDHGLPPISDEAARLCMGDVQHNREPRGRAGWLQCPAAARPAGRAKSPRPWAG